MRRPSFARLSDVGARRYGAAIEDRAARLRAHLCSRAGVCEAGAGFVDARRFLPPSYCRELTKLQENLEPITHEHAEARFRTNSA